MKKVNEEHIVSMFASGLSISAIAKKENVSRQCIYNILNRKKVKYKKQGNLNKEAIVRDLAHHKIIDVMRKHNLPYSKIKKIMREENIEKIEIAKDILQRETVARLYWDMGFSDEEIANIFCCSPYTVRSFRWKQNIYDKNRKWQDIMSGEEFCQMRKRGMGLSEIAKKTGLPYHIIVRANKLFIKREKE